MTNGTGLLRIDLLLPAHNEGASIGEVLEEFHRQSEADGLDVRLVVSEDGSSDDTRAVVEHLGETLPISLLPPSPRKGYSKAVVDGLLATTAPYVVFCDSDGQYDPADMRRLYDSLGDNDLAVGYRNPRNDPRSRKLISGAFRLVYERLFPVRLKDPSCPFVLLRRECVDLILRGNPGLLSFGFWWEFNARALAAGLHVVEVPVTHSPRAHGKTQVYRLQKLPGIALGHLRALFILRRELQSLADPRQESAPTYQS